MSKPKNTALDGDLEMRYSILRMKTNNTIQLPETVTQYIEAANRFDAVGGAACFAPDATVHDEQEEHVGLAAIENWIRDTSSKYQPQVTVVAAETRGQTLRFTAMVTGSFPSSPAELNYEVHLRGGKIAQLTIR